MASSKYASIPEETSKLPGGIKYIIGNEAAERYSFYGMRTILVVFMTKYLHFMAADGQVGTAISDAAANEYYHQFVAATYLFPVMGSFLSDVLIGKYNTILWLSIVYCLGHLALAFMGGAGLAPGTWMFIGLFLIAFGSGGIKPCVSAHVGDQFGKKNSHLMPKVFQWFYFAINFGSTASTWMIPVLLKWYGPHVAFGVPGVLMAIATFLFWLGRNKFIHVPAGGLAFFKETFSREGVTALLKLSVIYAFVAVFWGLFDQTGSSWVIQAENMDRNFLGVEWLQSQIQVLNPILVMLLIPLFQFVIYPSVNKVFQLTPIRKLSIGFFFAAASFATVAQAQELIDAGQTPSIQWQLWAYVLLTAGEVMISITGLEFSYTQAPKTMKSVIMAVWLFSVSLGNIFTSVVNNQIQVPGVNEVASVVKTAKQDTEDSVGTWTYKTQSLTLESASGDQPNAKTGKKMIISGVDGQFGTDDDVELSFNEYNKLTSVDTAEGENLKAASKVIEEAFFASSEDDQAKALPQTEAGQKLIASLKDSWGSSYTYKQLSRNKYRISSAGADKTAGSQWDVVLKGDVSRAAKKDANPKDVPYDWLESRRIEIGGDEAKAQVDKERGATSKTEIGTDITVGGQDTLEGAAYFWFWTNTILVTAILFIPVGYFYKEKSYIQSDEEEVDEAAAPSEATDAPTDERSDG